MNKRAAAQALGRRGGRARAARLSAIERARIASLGGHARRRSLHAAWQADRNHRYAAAVVELRRGSQKVVRVKTCRGPLPGIYPPPALNG